jgi:hypothetical protein
VTGQPPPELEARVASLEAKLEAMTLAAKNTPNSFGGAQFQQAIVAALERQEVPPVDAMGLGLHPEARYVELETWKAKNSVANGEAPMLRASDPAILHRPQLFVRTGTPWEAVRRLRAEKGLAA